MGIDVNINISETAHNNEKAAQKNMVGGRSIGRKYWTSWSKYAKIETVLNKEKMIEYQFAKISFGHRGVVRLIEKRK